jgi:trimethylamine:corrinoid methyltransferase-like protein
MAEAMVGVITSQLIAPGSRVAVYPPSGGQMDMRTGVAL